MSKIQSQECENYTLLMTENVTSEDNERLKKLTAVRKDPNLNPIMKDLWEYAKSGSWEIDLNTQTAFWSPIVYEIHELTPESDISSNEALDFYHGKDKEIITKAVQNAIDYKVPFDLKLRIITAKGNIRNIRIAGKAITQNHEVVKLRGLLSDADQLRQTDLLQAYYDADVEKKVKIKTEEIKNINANLEAFAYSVSHDLRAPLRAIDGFSKALMDYYEGLPITAQRYLSRIVRNSERMSKLIDDLLCHSRLSRSSVIYENFNLRKMIQSIIKDLNPSEKWKIKTINLRKINGDKLLLRQVFQNLLSNAIKYSSKVEHPQITVEQISHSSKDEVIISDNGSGFDMKYYDKLFQIFQRLHSESEFEGTGVGLAICKTIIDKHFGDIYAEGETGKGSSFHITLPNKKKQVT